MKSRQLTLAGYMILLAMPIHAQETKTSIPEEIPGFIRQEANIIQRAESLLPLYERLYDIRNEKPEAASIVHMGDSHIQADYFTGAVRDRLQQQFGNAGLGLTFPGRAARTNESPSIFSSARGEWEINKITYSQNKSTIGIGGMALKTSQVGNSITIRALSAQNDFDRLTIFFQNDFSSFNITVRDSAGQILAITGPFSEGQINHTSRLKFPYAINQVKLEASQFMPSQEQLTLYGVSMEKSRPGIRYHIIGVNGARFRHFLSSTELLKQTAALDARLIIISLGTNEAGDHPAIDPKLNTQVNSLIAELKRINPTSTLLLTTPADFFKKQTRRNPGVQLVRKLILEAASAHELPCWDLYEIAGGNHAADRWKKAGLLQADGIHFTKKGYELQGKLLYEAIMKGYNEYVLHRFSETH